jgi:hypothetical protein
MHGRRKPSRQEGPRGTGGPATAEVTFIFEEVPGGGSTRFTQSQEAEPGGFFRLTGPIVERAAKRQLRNDVETLKDLLETHGQ